MNSSPKFSFDQMEAMVADGSNRDHIPGDVESCNEWR